MLLVGLVMIGKTGFSYQCKAHVSLPIIPRMPGFNEHPSKKLLDDCNDVQATTELTGLGWLAGQWLTGWLATGWLAELAGQLAVVATDWLAG